jgi:hypothetical protein
MAFPCHQLTASALLAALAACGGGGGSSEVNAGTPATVVSQTYASFGQSNSGSTAGVGCALGINEYNGSLKVFAQSTASWACNGSQRTLSANGIPDHPVTDGSFATPISAQVIFATFTLTPAIQVPGGTFLFRTGSGFALNGIKLDPGTAGTCAASATSIWPGGGCVAAGGRDAWNIEAIGGAFKFGTDSSNAHVQPNGQYHYHGVPEGLLSKLGKGSAMSLVGFAVDGFPIYARYGLTRASDASSAIKVMTSSYQYKAVPDTGRPSVALFPMGTFTQDYQYVAGTGDLDECNGRNGVTPEFPKGIYHYYITDTFPYIQRCVKG